MNHKGSINLTPGDFGRMLALHGRSSSALPTSKTGPDYDPVETLKRVITANNGSKEAGDDGEVKEKDKGDAEVMASLKKVEEKVVNPPLSKAASQKRDQAHASYSFYKRNFKVKGNQAWENAMRDLGSVDTLLNRYGFVEESHRSDPALARQDAVQEEGKRYN